jgi:hypothetical protein
MGSSRRPKRQGQPVRASRPGTGVSAGGIDPDQRLLPHELAIRLVRVDSGAATLTAVGDSVSVRNQAGVYSAYSVGRRLGDIPPRFGAALSRGYRSGVVSDVSTRPLRVVVTLAR